MKRQRESNSRTVVEGDPSPHLLLLPTDLLIEIGNQLDEATLICFCFTSKQSQCAVRQLCLSRGQPLESKDRISEEAALWGHLNIMIWLRDNTCPIDIAHCAYYAVMEDYLHIIQWLHDTIGPVVPSEYLWEKAAYHGRLEIMRWFLSVERAGKSDFEWPYGLCNLSARSGHLESLKWLRGEGCPWGSSTPNVSVESGDLEILKWTLENGCSYNARTLLLLAKHFRCTEIEEWIRENEHLYL